MGVFLIHESAGAWVGHWRSRSSSDTIMVMSESKPEVYVHRDGRTKLVQTPADRVAAEFSGFKVQEDAEVPDTEAVAPEDQSESLGQAPETDDTESGEPVSFA